MVASGGSHLACLGELGDKHLPHFPINRGRSEVKKGSAPEALLSLSNLLEKNCFREENLSGGASEPFP